MRTEVDSAYVVSVRRKKSPIWWGSATVSVYFHGKETNSLTKRAATAATSRYASIVVNGVGFFSSVYGWSR